MAVYTHVTEGELAAFLALYDLPALQSFTGISAGTENTNYLLHCAGGARFILTLYEKRVRAEDLPFFLGLMQHCATAGVACPQPVVSRSGEMLGNLAGRKAALTTFLDGASVLRPNAAQCGALGAALAEFHLASQSFAATRPNALSVGSWAPLLAECPRGDELQAGLQAKLEAECAHLAAHWPKALPTGVIHADLFPDNVFFMGDTVSGLIDFYFACSDFYAYDVAICLNAWCFEDDSTFNVTKARALLRGYVGKRPLNAAELEALPLLCRGAALRFLLTRLYDWFNSPPAATRRNPLAYWKRLFFHQQVKSVGDYGL